MDEADLPLHLEGLSIDAIYENYFRQIAGWSLDSKEKLNLKERIEQQKCLDQLEKQILATQTRIKKEKQPKKKFELVQQLHELQKERNEVTSEKYECD